jgi:hypothetical protein
MMTNVRLVVVVAVLSVVLFTRCEGESYSLSVTPEEVHLTSIHDHPVLTAFIIDAAGEEIPLEKVDWSTSDSRVVEINEDGKVSARGSGVATIMARTPRFETEVKVTVNLVVQE